MIVYYVCYFVLFKLLGLGLIDITKIHIVASLN